MPIIWEIGENQQLQSNGEAEAQSRQQTASLLEAAEAHTARLQLVRDELATQLMVSLLDLRFSYYYAAVIHVQYHASASLQCVVYKIAAGFARSSMLGL